MLCSECSVNSGLIIIFSVTMTHCPLPSILAWPGQTSFPSADKLSPKTFLSLVRSGVFILVERDITGEMAQRGVFLTSTFNKSSQPDFFEVKPYTVSPSRRSDSALKLKIFET